MSVYNILVVEDDEVDVMNIQRAFEKIKLLNPVSFAKDGLEALAFINENKIEKPLLILLDINMPRMNGLEFLQKLRAIENWKGTPVVILTTSNAEKDKIEAYNLQVAGYIIKPVELSNFVDAVSRIGSYWSLCEFPPANAK